MEIVIDLNETPDSRPVFIRDSCYWAYFKLQPITLHKRQYCSRCGRPAESRLIHKIEKVYHQIEERCDDNPSRVISVIPVQSEDGKEILREVQTFYQRVYCEKCP